MKLISEEAMHWFSENRSTFEALAKKVEAIVDELLQEEGIPVHAVTSRAKTLASFAGKTQTKMYEDPAVEITDLAGIRIITYVEEDLKRITSLINTHFDIDGKNSIDKRDTLGTDRVGYRSIHFIAKLPGDRIKLPEYKKFKGLRFEIQARTILQHAWAEIEHDKNYKFSGELPGHLQRRFKILAGVLELADREFDSLASDIDSYSNQVRQDAKRGELDFPVNSTSLKAYISLRFSDLVKEGLENTVVTEEVVRELTKFGLATLADIDAIVPKNLEEVYIKHNEARNGNSFGLFRDIMIAHDGKKYFEKSWDKGWTRIALSQRSLMMDLGIPFDEYVEKYRLEAY